MRDVRMTNELYGIGDGHNDIPGCNESFCQSTRRADNPSKRLARSALA